MSRFSRRSGVFRALAVITPAILCLEQGAAQPPSQAEAPDAAFPRQVPAEIRLPNGKLQRDEILKADYEQNVRDSAGLTRLATEFQLELEKSDRFVLSLGLLKKLDDIEKLTKRIRGRIRH